MRRITAALLLFLASCKGCDSPTRASQVDAEAPDARAAAVAATTVWPALPLTEDDARRTVSANATSLIVTANGEDGDAAVDDDVEGYLSTALDRGELVVGEAAIESFVEERAARAKNENYYLLWGTHHDSAAQVEMFRRVTGAMAKTRFTHVALEQLRADGHWAGVPLDQQHGDDAALARWRREGSRAALDDLRLSQERDDYAAWKFGYVGSILDVARDARIDHDVVGCDMPLAIQTRLGVVRESWGNTLRELHCALALSEKTKLNAAAGARVAMLWGAQHVGPNGVRRFLPFDAHVTSVRVIGQRPESADDPIARAVYDRFVLVEPVLVPLYRGTLDHNAATTSAIVVLPESALPSAHFERKRTHEVAAASAADAAALRRTGELIVSSGLRGPASDLRIDAKSITASRTETTVPLPFGKHVLSVGLRSPGRKTRTLVAPLFLTDGASADLRLEADAPEVTLTIHD